MPQAGHYNFSNNGAAVGPSAPFRSHPEILSPHIPTGSKYGEHGYPHRFQVCRAPGLKSGSQFCAQPLLILEALPVYREPCHRSGL